MPVDNLWITHQYTDDQYTDDLARFVPGFEDTGGGVTESPKFLLNPLKHTKK